MIVLSAARAARLARRAADGGQGWLARRAWRRLTSAADGGDGNAIEVIWQAWLREPADDSWALVSRWRTPADVFAAAVDPTRTASSRAALGTFCLRHEWAPDNPVERAVFFVLTGQPAQYQALDPDGRLLANGYRGAAGATREALRHTMTGLGELNTLRVIADRPDRPLTTEEANYLAGQLAGAGEWDQLWRLVPTIPLTGAVRAIRLFRDWRPADDAGRALFERLAGTDPEVITALGPAAVTRLDVANPLRLSFAPDNSELAVRRSSGTTIFALPGGHPIATYAGRQQFKMLALGDAMIVYQGGRSDNWSVVHCCLRERLFTYVIPAGHGPLRTELLPDRPDAFLGRTREGFVVVSRGDVWWFGPYVDSGSRVVRGPDLPVAIPSIMDGVAINPASGQLAISELDKLHLLDADLRILATGTVGGYVREGAFPAPGHLITPLGGGQTSLVSWRQDGKNLVREAEIQLDTGPVTPVPGHDLVAAWHRRELTWLVASTLEEAGPPPWFPPVDARSVTFSQDGSLAAVATRDGVEVHDLAVHRLAALAGRSIVELTRSDLETVGTPGNHSMVAPVLALVGAGMEYRFGADIALGSNTRVAARDDDIALGGPRPGKDDRSNGQAS